MERRGFMTLVGCAAAATAWPLVARGQQPRLPTIGILGPATASVAARWTGALVQRLHELGWIEGRTVAIEYRWVQGSSERAVEIVSEFVRLKVDVIVTSGVRYAIAAKQVTSAIPIVFVSAGDPVGSGLVASLARPGANVTGLSHQWTELAGKRIELLREVTPGLSRMAVMVNPSNPDTALEMVEVQTAASTLGLEVVTREIRRTEDIVPAFEAIKGRVQALRNVVFDNGPLINTLAFTARLPTMHSFRRHVVSGGLMSYGANYIDLSRRAADYVDKILRGVKPADLAVQQPTKFELVINLRTAKALGIEIPPRLLVLADELIE